MRLRAAIALFAILACAVRADVIDQHSALQSSIDELALDLHGGRWTVNSWEKSTAPRSAYGLALRDAAARAVWSAPLPDPADDPLAAARNLGALLARIQHAAALEMLAELSLGDIEGARAWRAVISIPKYANAVEGALALQRMGVATSHREEVVRLLAREYVTWQTTRAREKADQLMRLVQSGRATPQLVAARSSEIHGLSEFPADILHRAARGSKMTSLSGPAEAHFAALQSAIDGGEMAAIQPALNAWRLANEASLPNLLTEDDVNRKERVVLKLLRLIPMEYQAGVRDGQVTVPLEYREAKSFTIQAKQIVSELLPTWQKTKTEALAKHGATLGAGLEALEDAITAKKDALKVESLAKDTSQLLQSEFKIASKRSGRATDVVAETMLEVRSLLGQSLAAARSGQWRKAEALRLDAYINFDLEIEGRTLPRDPELALRTERSFLDGSPGMLGIKAALDAHSKADELNAAYQRALDGVEECAALLRVGLSPSAAIASAIVIVTREGLEAVIILAALLAGLRGTENARIRKRVAGGAWMAVAASGLLFAVSQSVLSGLSRYGELLEAVISLLAVLVLLMVTNWVFHKVYWVGWNARLRELSKAARARRSPRAETLALIGVGFMTIFREGFETTLFMQSLILEAGMRPVLIGLTLGGVIIAVLGFAVFSIGAHLPYRKMLVYTGVLVVFVLVTFVGSTVRLLQTVGWMPVHPVPGLEFPAWTGLWLGIYPTWEGILLPLGSLAYVGAMWLWVKIAAMRARATEGAEAGSATPSRSSPTPEVLRDRVRPPRVIGRIQSSRCARSGGDQTCARGR